MTDTNNRNTALMRLVEQQVESLDRSDEETDTRKGIRENVDKLGIDPRAFQNEVGALRRMKPQKRDYYIASQAEMRALLEGKREELFPDIVAAEAEADKKKADKAAAKAAGGKTAASSTAAAAAESKPKGDGKQETGDEMIKRIAAEKNAELEQREGKAALDRVGTKTIQ